MKKVNIKIKGGKVSADFSGFMGKSCETLEKRIRPDELEVEERELKPEYGFNEGQSQTDTETNEW
jgi:hypothetical protein